MSNQRAANDVLSIAYVERQLFARGPQVAADPTLDRITKAMALLGEPQRAYRCVHLTGTNGKTSTARMVEAILAESGAHTGRFTSPHLTSITERITIGEQAIDVPGFVSAYTAVTESARQLDAALPDKLSFFEMTVAMAYQAFREAAIDVAVVEVGMGGQWDATNVIDADVAVILPVALDHTEYLGTTTAAIASEKAGIIKPGGVAVSARQSPEVARVLKARASAVGARIFVAEEDFFLHERQVVDSGQRITVRGLHDTYSDVLLTLRGQHQAENAACAVAAAELVLGHALDSSSVRSALARVTSPGRFDVRPGSPTVILDAAHNPHGARALAATLREGSPCRTFAVVAAMADKHVEGMLRALEPAVDVIVCTRNSSPRSLSPADLAWFARQVFGAQRVHLAPTVETAIGLAKRFAAPARHGCVQSALVLVTGSVVTVGDAMRVVPAVAPPAESTDLSP